MSGNLSNSDFAHKLNQKLVSADAVEVEAGGAEPVLLGADADGTHWLYPESYFRKGHR